MAKGGSPNKNTSKRPGKAPVKPGKGPVTFNPFGAVAPPMKKGGKPC